MAGTARHRRRWALVATVAALASMPASASADCANPAPGREFARATPAASGLDAAGLARVSRFMVQRGAFSVRVYRHGCLVARSSLDPLTEALPNNVWSSTKGVVSLLTGAAITDGKLSLDDPIARYLPQADAAHGAITVRQLLTQTSGLKFAWFSDISARDQVKYTLGLPFVHAPGTYFEYAQTTVTLLGAVVAAAVGEDLQAYAQQRLFGPLGIPRRDWSWSRDRSGTTEGFAFLSMAPRSLGRFGQLLLQEGRWGSQQLLSPDYVRAMSQSTPTNPAYGFLVWTNAGRSMVTATMPSRRILDQRFLPPAPADTYAFVGFLGQLVIVIPSLDMVLVRTGLPGNRDPDAHSLLTVKAGDMDYESIRGVMQAVTDVDVPDPGPYVPVTRFDPLDISRFFDLPTMISALQS